MVRRISLSQFKSEVRKLQNQQKRAIDDYNRKVRAHNNAVDKTRREINREIDNYNREVRAHNNRVRANRARYNAAVANYNRSVRALSSSTFSTSVVRVSETYNRVEARAESGAYDEGLNGFLDLAEREAANSMELANQIANDDGSAPASESVEFDADPELVTKLESIGGDLAGRWQGAVFSLNPRNPDAARHFCTSARELFVQIFSILAPDATVEAANPECARTPNGQPTRRAKIDYLLRSGGVVDGTLADFVDSDVENVISLFGVFNDGTHGSVGTFSIETLRRVKQRVENGLDFLCRLRNVMRG